MSPSTPTNERRSPSPSLSLPEPLRAAAFWAAVLLPLCSLALVFVGIETTTEYLLFGALVAANVAALIVGHGYGR